MAVLCISPLFWETETGATIISPSCDSIINGSKYVLEGLWLLLLWQRIQKNNTKTEQLSLKVKSTNKWIKNI